ncbi:hypothetical protein LAZ67_X004463 [Cordylochernes scorpioides]|uniref:Reverse transcriptase RNase H-like domain-containing protein n=1 Tax=Cordylochernes scorpioides TaxID=51811 RepID=A0ABY6LVE4_9ARAC|nr:hypothetical protein LAZ67_X004463 [Cordylochernes scorpioides]
MEMDEKYRMLFKKCKSLLMDYGLGVILSRRNDRKEECPIAFASRTLTEAEERYSQLEKEALSITYGDEKSRQYLLGRNFVLVTDNRPLIHIFSPQKPIPICAASRIKRWSLKLAAFNHTEEFRKVPQRSLIRRQIQGVLVKGSRAKGGGVLLERRTDGSKSEREGSVSNLANELSETPVDGAPPHYHRDVRAYLNQNLSGQWIGRRGPIEFPARSPDLTPLDFFLWGTVKDVVYKRKPRNLDILWIEIQAVCREISLDVLIRCTESVVTRTQNCIDAAGHQFEQY